MGTNTPERAAEEAAFVAETLGPNLQYFQIGNEGDLFGRHLRDAKTWSAKIYLQEWLALAPAVTLRVAGGKIAMPHGASDAAWLSENAGFLPSIENPPPAANPI